LKLVILKAWLKLETKKQISNNKMNPKMKTSEIYQKRFTSSRFVIRNWDVHGSACHYYL
jgi:hypothetical protein